MALGELQALLGFMGLALLGSELAGVGCSRADRLALLIVLGPSELVARGGDTEAVLGGVSRGPTPGIEGNGPCGLRALVGAIRGSTMTACACSCRCWVWGE